MARYGTGLVIDRGGEQIRVRGFFQAVNSKSWQSMESEATPLGEISRGQYLYMGPVETELKEGDTIRLGGKQYLVRRAECYWAGDENVYRWGLCVEKGVNDTWGSQF